MKKKISSISLSIFIALFFYIILIIGVFQIKNYVADPSLTVSEIIDERELQIKKIVEEEKQRSLTEFFTECDHIECLKD